MLGQADGHRLATLLLDRCPERDAYRVDVQIAAGLLAMLMTDADGAKGMLGQARSLGHGAVI